MKIEDNQTAAVLMSGNHTIETIIKTKVSYHTAYLATPSEITTYTVNESNSGELGYSTSNWQKQTSPSDVEELINANSL